MFLQRTLKFTFLATSLLATTVASAFVCPSSFTKYQFVSVDHAQVYVKTRPGLPYFGASFTVSSNGMLDEALQGFSSGDNDICVDKSMHYVSFAPGNVTHYAVHGDEFRANMIGEATADFTLQGDTLVVNRIAPNMVAAANNPNLSFEARKKLAYIETMAVTGRFVYRAQPSF